MPLPPYLTSFASSRAHHALLVKLDGAVSAQAEDAAVIQEVERCRNLLATNPSSSRIAETLIILLNCAMTSHTKLDLEFALVPALHLAEAGRTMRERRRGYLYLSERLPPGHELHLMLVNTIRKDLASYEHAHILAALHAIVHLPGHDLAPAVVPLLVSKRLLEHDEPAIRQRTIQAISALSVGRAWPLSLKEIARRIRHEDDPSALAAVLRIYAQALESGLREADPARRKRQFDSVFAAAARRMDSDSPLVISAIRALVAIVRTLPRHYEEGDAESRDELVSHAITQTRSLLAEAVELHTTPGVSQWARACLFETSALAAALFEIDGRLGPAVETLMNHLRQFLLPQRDKGKGKATPPAAVRGPTPADVANNRILALRCFGLLPAAAWQDGLTEAHMAALMGGVDSNDPTLRRETLRLLAKVDRNLPLMTLQSHLEAIRSGQGVPLAPDVEGGKSRRDGVADGRTEAACRALETADILAQGLDDAEQGTQIADGVSDISKALRDGGDSSVWLKGVQTVLGDLQSSSHDFRQAFIKSAAESLAQDPQDSTLAVLLTTVAVEYPGSELESTISALLPALDHSPASVQELIVLALVPLLSGTALAQRDALATDILASLERVKAAGAIKHMVKRCTEVALIVERGMVDDVVRRSKSRALNDVLDAILIVYAEATKPPSRDTSSPASTPMSASMTASALRYDAYTSPSTGSPRRVTSPLGRGAELSQSVSTNSTSSSNNKNKNHANWAAMGRSTLVEADELAMDDLSITGGGGGSGSRGSSERSRHAYGMHGSHMHGGATPTDRTPRLRAADY